MMENKLIKRVIMKINKNKKKKFKIEQPELNLKVKCLILLIVIKYLFKKISKIFHLVTFSKLTFNYHYVIGKGGVGKVN